MVKCFLQNAIKCTSQCEHKNTTFHFYRMAWNTLDDKWQFVLQLKNVILFIIWGTEKELRISENVFHTNHSTSQTWLLLWLHYCKAHRLTPFCCKNIGSFISQWSYRFHYHLPISCVSDFLYVSPIFQCM